MIRINLLPHRELKRKRRQRDFYVMLIFIAGLGATIWFAMHTYFIRQFEVQEGRNSYLEKEISKLDLEIDEIKKLKEQTTAMLQRKSVVESLQANRAETVYLLDQLVRQLPDGVYLKAISQKGPRITLNGYAQSNARVSTFMRNLEASPYLESPSLIEIKGVTDKNIRLSEFSLAVSLTRSKNSVPAKPDAKPLAGGAPIANNFFAAAQTADVTAPQVQRRSSDASPVTTASVIAASATSNSVARADGAAFGSR